VAATEAAGAVLESIGHVVEPTRVTALDDPTFIETFLVVWAAGIAHDVDHYWSGKLGRALGQADVEPLTWALVEAGRAASSSDYLAARQKLQGISRQVAQWYETGFDVLLTPTIAQPPPLIGEFDSPADNPLHGLLRAAELVPFTPPFNVSGQPAISLPLHWNDQGLPIGVQLVAPYGREDVLLRVAAQLEEAAPWAARRPPVSA
jgi:amidase